MVDIYSKIRLLIDKSVNLVVKPVDFMCNILDTIQGDMMVRYIRREYRLYKTADYEVWYKDQSPKAKYQIRDRLETIASEGYFGSHRVVTDFVSELKWKNGRRIYYAFITESNILILLGGNKNGQSKDIRKAESILEKYCETQS